MTHSDFELNETHDSADRFPEFDNKTHTEISHSNTGHLKDVASCSSEMINDLVDLTNLQDVFPSFRLIGSSEEREELNKETDLAFKLLYLSTELKPTERLVSYWHSVLNVSECIEPVRFEKKEEVTCAG